jgi:hypothetical protein
MSITASNRSAKEEEGQEGATLFPVFFVFDSRDVTCGLATLPTSSGRVTLGHVDLTSAKIGQGNLK